MLNLNTTSYPLTASVVTIQTTPVVYETGIFEPGIYQ